METLAMHLVGETVGLGDGPLPRTPEPSNLSLLDLRTHRDPVLYLELVGA